MPIDSCPPGWVQSSSESIAGFYYMAECKKQQVASSVAFDAGKYAVLIWAGKPGEHYPAYPYLVKLKTAYLNTHKI